MAIVGFIINMDPIKGVERMLSAKKRHVKSEYWFNKKGRDGNPKGKASKTTNNQSCIVSYLDDGEVLYSEVMRASKSKKHFYDVWVVDSSVT